MADVVIYQVFPGSENNPDHNPGKPPKKGMWVWWRTGEHPHGRWQAMNVDSTPEGKAGLAAWRENQQEFPIWQDRAHGSAGDWGGYTCHACGYLGEGYPEPGHMTVCDGICKRENCRDHTNAFGSPEYIAGIREGLTRLRTLTDEHGFNKGAVMFLTGLNASEVDNLGGLPDE